MYCKGPACIGLFRVSDEFIQIIAQRRQLANPPVRLLGIIPQEITHEMKIKNRRLVYFINMPISKLILDGSVKTFQVSIRLRMTGIIKVMNQVLSLTSFTEML